MSAADPFEELMRAWNGQPDDHDILQVFALGEDGALYGIGLSVDRVIARAGGQDREFPFFGLCPASAILLHGDAAYIYRQAKPTETGPRTQGVGVRDVPRIQVGDDGNRVLSAALDVGSRTWQFEGRGVSASPVSEPEDVGIAIRDCIVHWNWKVEP